MNWIELRVLNNLYSKGEVKLNDTVAKSGEINYLMNSLRILDRTNNKLFILEGFKELYEKDYMEKYHRYEAFLFNNGLLKPQLRIEESDIQILMGIKEDMDNGNLEPLREQIIKNEATLRVVSLMFFKNEKYLIGKESLINAIKLFLIIDELADDKDQQYKFVLECSNPRCIVLCENIDFLKRPTIARANKIELWYAGGKNVNKLEFSDSRGLPIYYSCDWDYDGLEIYSLVKQKIPCIELLLPNGQPMSITATEHKSLWRNIDCPDALSGLDLNIFSDTQIKLIQELIRKDSWIIEESNDLIKMVY